MELSSLTYLSRRFKPEFFNRETRLDYPNAQTSKGSRKYVKQMKKLDVSFEWL